MGSARDDIRLGVERRREHIALIHAPSRAHVNYAELATAVERLARALRDAGVGPGDRVALLDGNTIEHVVGWYAARTAGAIVVDVNILLGDEELRHILEDCEPAVVLAGPAFVARAAAATVAIVWSTDALPSPSEHPATAVRPLCDEVAVIAYTSGTTGLPKGVVHRDATIAEHLDLLCEIAGYDEDWVSYVAIPLFSLHGFLPQIAATLRCGGTVVLDDKFDARRFAEATRRWRVTHTTLSPSMLPHLLALPDAAAPDLSHIRLLTCGGAPLHPEVRQAFEKRFGIRLTQGYGATELLSALVMNLAGDAPSDAVGRIHATRADVVRILGEDGRALDHGEIGEIAFHRSCALDSYWRQPAATAAAFVADEWYLTGDIGRLDDAGFLAVLDRKRDVIIRGGFNIYSAEIERVLSEHPGVAEAIVVPAPDPILGQVPVAFVVPAAETALDPDEVTTYARARLGRLKAPQEVRVVGFSYLPRNGVGKVLKAALIDELRSEHLASDPEPLEGT